MTKKIFAIPIMLVLLALPVMAYNDCVVKDKKWKCIDNGLKGTDLCDQNKNCEDIATALTYKLIENIHDATKYKIDVFGTEYNENDAYGKIFIQLLNSSNGYIDSTQADCFTSVYYPNAMIFINSSLMAYADEGLFFLDLAIPETNGVYMIAVICYMPDVINYTIWDDMETGNISGGSGWSSDWNISSANCYFDNDPARNPRDTWQLTCEDTANVTREFNSSSVGNVYITFWGKSYFLEAGDFCYWEYYNGTGWITLLTHTDGDETANLNYYSYEVSQYGLSENSSFRMRGVGDSFDYCHIDDIEIEIAVEDYGQNYGYQEVRGSGELHVSKQWSCENEILCHLEHARILNDRVVNFHNHQYCIDNMTLQSNVTYEYCIGGNCRLLEDIMDEHCNYGCDYVTNSCSPNPTMNSIYLIIIFAVFVFLIYLFARLIK